jgi:hypothetical protein
LQCGERRERALGEAGVSRGEREGRRGVPQETEDLVRVGQVYPGQPDDADEQGAAGCGGEARAAVAPREEPRQHGKKRERMVLAEEPRGGGQRPGQRQDAPATGHGREGGPDHEHDRHVFSEQEARIRYEPGAGRGEDRGEGPGQFSGDPARQKREQRDEHGTQDRCGEDRRDAARTEDRVRGAGDPVKSRIDPCSGTTIARPRRPRSRTGPRGHLGRVRVARGPGHAGRVGQRPCEAQREPCDHAHGEERRI